jgi:hypothetical protein
MPQELPMKDQNTLLQKKCLPMEQDGTIRLSIEDQQRFAEALINPPPLTPAMKRAIEHHRRLFGPTHGDV